MNEEKENKAREKIKSAPIFLRKNALLLVAIAVCLFYVATSLIQIVSTDKTVFEIIRDSLIAFIMGMILTILMANYGIAKGKDSVAFLSSKKQYSDSIERVDEYIQYLDDYCEEKNVQRLKKEKIKYLRRYAIRYVDYENGTINFDKLTDEQKEALKNVDKIKILQLDMEYLLSDCDATTLNQEKNSKKYDIHRFTRKLYTQNIVMKIVFALLTGMCAVQLLQDATLANFIWSLFNVTIWFAFSILAFRTSYSYIVDDYRQNVIILKINYLHEFYNLMHENPNRYKEKDEEKPIYYLENKATINNENVVVDEPNNTTTTINNENERSEKNA